jgi:hypothetical protein
LTWDGLNCREILGSYLRDIYIWDKYKYIYNYIYIREIYGIDLGNLGEIPSLLGFVGGSHFVDSLGYSWGYRISFCR